MISGNSLIDTLILYTRKFEKQFKTGLISCITAFLILVFHSTGYSQSVGDYRSNKSNGNWSVSSHWETYNGTAWVAASVAPGDVAGAGTVTIIDGNNFSLNTSPAFAIGSLTVGGGTSGTLATSNGDFTINITNNILVRTGATLNLSRMTLSAGGTTTINGNIIDDHNNGSATFTGLVTINNGGSFTTANTSAFNFRGGITNNGTFNQSAAGAVTFSNNAQTLSGTSTITINGIVTVTGITITNNGIVELTSTAANALTGTGTWAQGNGSTLNFSGASMNITGTTFSTNTNTVNYKLSGTQTIKATTYHNLNISTSGTKTLGGTITVNGNIAISSAALGTSNFNIDVKGNWSNSGGSFNAGTGLVTFSGTSAQSISNNTQSFYNVTFNNTFAGTAAIILNEDITITNQCTMTDGIISTGTNKLILTNTTASNLTGYSSACYVNGNLRRSITNNTSTYAFPVGSSAYQLAEIINNNMTTTTTLDAKFGTLTNHFDAEITACDGILCYTSASFAGMWTIDANANPGSGSYDIYCYITNITGMVDNEFAILKRPVGTSASSWIAETAGSINADNGLGRLVSHGYALRKSITAFSEFAIGRKQSGVALPIQLVNFTASLNENKTVDIKWTTATEINNDYFTIERSADGINFVAIATISGAGNSATTIRYNHVDFFPLKGISYYRLKQTDFDGTSTCSKIVSVTIENEVVNVDWNIYPNPVIRGNKLNITSSATDKHYEIQLIDLTSGKIVCHHKTTHDIDELHLDENLIPGIYFARILDEHHKEVKTIKILVK
jgi:fibronectin-binding autotransporter adhesin